MPIENLSDVLRLPRLGKIRLGEQKTNQQGKTYPDALDHFLVREDDGITSKEAAQAFHEVYGDQPKVIDIMFPSEDPTAIFPQYYTSYGKTTGKVCQGDGVTARRWVGEGKDRKLTDIPCPGMDCDWFKTKKCRRLGTLQVILPNVPGLGVWHISTTSKNSLININSGIALLKTITGAQSENGLLVGGRIAFIPLKLRLREMDVQKPDGKLGTIYVLDLANEKVRFADIMQAMNTPPLKAFLPDPQEDPRPTDLFPDAVVVDEPVPAPLVNQVMSADDKEKIHQEIVRVISELGIAEKEASQIAKERFGKIDTFKKLDEFVLVLRAIAAERKTKEDPPTPALSEDEQKKMSQEIVQVVAELGLEQEEVLAMVGEFGKIDSHARHNAFLQLLRDKAAQKGQQGTDFEAQAVKVGESLDIPEQVVRQIIRDQFDVIDSQESLDALVRALNELHDEYLVRAGKTDEKAEETPAAVSGKPVEPGEPEDPEQAIKIFFAGLNPLIEEAKGKGIKCNLGIVAQQAGYKDPGELRKALTNPSQVNKIFTLVREKLGMTAA